MMKYFIHLERPTPHWVQVPPEKIAGTFHFMGHNWFVHPAPTNGGDWPGVFWNVSHVARGVCAAGGQTSPEEAITYACLQLYAVGAAKVNRLLRKFPRHQ